MHNFKVNILGYKKQNYRKYCNIIFKVLKYFQLFIILAMYFLPYNTNTPSFYLY